MAYILQVFQILWKKCWVLKVVIETVFSNYPTLGTGISRWLRVQSEIVFVAKFKESRMFAEVTKSPICHIEIGFEVDEYSFIPRCFYESLKRYVNFMETFKTLDSFNWRFWFA